MSADFSAGKSSGLGVHRVQEKKELPPGRAAKARAGRTQVALRRPEYFSVAER